MLSERCAKHLSWFISETLVTLKSFPSKFSNNLSASWVYRFISSVELFFDLFSYSLLTQLWDCLKVGLLHNYFQYILKLIVITLDNQLSHVSESIDN